MKLLQLTANTGPEECCLAVRKALAQLLRECEAAGVRVELLEQVDSERRGNLRSVLLALEGEGVEAVARRWKGSLLWVCPSPYRPRHARKNWFIGGAVFDTGEPGDGTGAPDERDIRYEAVRASGPGGQHVNKTDSAIRITHFPSGIVVQCQNERSQHSNKATAMKMLMARLYEREKEEQLRTQENIQGDKKEIAWGSQIRSYVLQPYRLIKDHRTNTEEGNVDAVLDGRLDSFIRAYLLWQP